MTFANQLIRRLCPIGFRPPIIAICVLIAVAALPCGAQTFTVLHSFTGREGSMPTAGLSIDRAGNLYGTAAQGGHTGGNCYNGCGTVFKLAHKNAGWVLSVLYTFTGLDGALPISRVVLGPDGSLYGTTDAGGASAAGNVFRLQPPATFCHAVLCPWTETILYTFGREPDGASPGYGDLAFDSAGNLYGTTFGGGAYGQGTVFELTPANGAWTKTTVYSFQGNGDGAVPEAGVAIDAQGNLYGTTVTGGTDGEGTVYELSPSGSGWTERVLHSFTQFGDDGSQPYGGLIFDQAGNLYGTTPTSGRSGGGTAFELTPSQGGWNFNVLYSFNAYEGSFGSMTIGPDGKLYGTQLDGNVDVFQLAQSGGEWGLAGFFGRSEDFSFGNVVFDASGNIYYTFAGAGGVDSGGVVELTP